MPIIAANQESESVMGADADNYFKEMFATAYSMNNEDFFELIQDAALSVNSEEQMQMVDTARVFHRLNAESITRKGMVAQLESIVAGGNNRRKEARRAAEIQNSVAMMDAAGYTICAPIESGEDRIKRIVSVLEAQGYVVEVSAVEGGGFKYVASRRPQGDIVKTIADLDRFGFHAYLSDNGTLHAVDRNVAVHNARLGSGGGAGEYTSGVPGCGADDTSEAIKRAEAELENAKVRLSRRTQRVLASERACRDASARLAKLKGE